MKKKTKKLAALLLSLLMVISLMSGTGLTVDACENETCKKIGQYCSWREN